MVPVGCRQVSLDGTDGTKCVCTNWTTKSLARHSRHETSASLSREQQAFAGYNMWDLWGTKCKWRRSVSQYFHFSLPLSVLPPDTLRSTDSDTGSLQQRTAKKRLHQVFWSHWDDWLEPKTASLVSATIAHVCSNNTRRHTHTHIIYLHIMSFVCDWVTPRSFLSW